METRKVCWYGEEKQEDTMVEEGDKGMEEGDTMVGMRMTRTNRGACMLACM